MRKLFLVAIGLVLGAGLAAAQGHDNAQEKTVKDTVTFATDVTVGTTVLKAGEYRVECNGEKIKFYLMIAAEDRDRLAVMTEVDRSMQIGNGKKVLEAVCKGKMLSEPRTATEAKIVEKNGKQTLEVLYLRGSNVEHVFN